MFIRKLLLISSSICITLLIAALAREDMLPSWKRYQKTYAATLRARPDKGKGKARKAFSIRVRQVFLPDLNRVDRCVTCHVAIEDPGMADLPQPLTTHPGDLLDTHEVERYGCTICHHGQGRAMTSAAEGHGNVEHWLTPMFEGNGVQAGCLKCHTKEPFVKDAPVLNKGRRLVSELGCFGCHGPGLLTPAEKPKQIGYNLNEIRQKLDPNWCVQWLESTQKFRPDTLMPDYRFGRAEAVAIASYLWQHAEPRGDLGTLVPFSEKNVAPGKRLFESRGCLACHKVGKEGNTYAANLSRIGEKTSYEYLANWIRNPRKYQPKGEMLCMNMKTPEEAEKIAAFLSTLRQEPPTDSEVRLDIPERAKAGKDLIATYNCYGCHAISGFEDTKKRVPKLLTIGAIPIEKFDFGLLEKKVLQSGNMHSRRENVGKARRLWIENKLKAPRSFDEGMDKKPDERLRMPDYGLSSERIHALTVFLLGLTGEQLPPGYRRVPPAVERMISSGRILFLNHRCFACHGKEGSGGVKNPNYAKETVPTLRTLAEKLHLEDREDAEKIMQVLAAQKDLDQMVLQPPVEHFPIVLHQYEVFFQLIRKGKLVSPKDPKLPEPPFHMPSCKMTLSRAQINDIVVYLLSLYPWEEED